METSPKKRARNEDRAPEKSPEKRARNRIETNTLASAPKKGIEASDRRLKHFFSWQASLVNQEKFAKYMLPVPAIYLQHPENFERERPGRPLPALDLDDPNQQLLQGGEPEDAQELLDWYEAEEGGIAYPRAFDFDNDVELRDLKKYLTISKVAIQTMKEESERFFGGNSSDGYAHNDISVGGHHRLHGSLDFEEKDSAALTQNDMKWVMRYTPIARYLAFYSRQRLAEATATDRFQEFAQTPMHNRHHLLKDIESEFVTAHVNPTARRKASSAFDFYIKQYLEGRDDHLWPGRVAYNPDQMFPFFRDRLIARYKQVKNRGGPGLYNEDITRLLGYYYAFAKPLLMPSLNDAVERAESYTDAVATGSEVYPPERGVTQDTHYTQFVRELRRHVEPFELEEFHYATKKYYELDSPAKSSRDWVAFLDKYQKRDLWAASIPDGIARAVIRRKHK